MILKCFLQFPTSMEWIMVVNCRQFYWFFDILPTVGHLPQRSSCQMLHSALNPTPETSNLHATTRAIFKKWPYSIPCNRISFHRIPTTDSTSYCLKQGGWFISPFLHCWPFLCQIAAVPARWYTSIAVPQQPPFVVAISLAWQPSSLQNTWEKNKLGMIKLNDKRWVMVTMTMMMMMMMMRMMMMMMMIYQMLRSQGYYYVFFFQISPLSRTHWTGNIYILSYR